MEKLNSWLTLVGNIGILVGLGLVVLELRQNTDMTMAQTRAELSRDVVGLFQENMDDTDYAAVLLKGNMGADLSDVEQYQFDRHRNAWLQYWQNVVYQHAAGLYDDQEFSNQLEIIRRDMESFPGLKNHWCQARSWRTKALIEAIEGESIGVFCVTNE